jgi:hypothetical protein
MKIYMTGYTGKTVAELPALLEALDAVLADIRFAPHSRHLEWRKNYLTLLLKHNYHHVPQLGNRKYKEGGVQIHNLELGKTRASNYGNYRLERGAAFAF